MKTTKIDLSDEGFTSQGDIDASISIVPFITYLEQKLKSEQSQKKVVYELAISKLKSAKGYENPIDLNEVEKFEQLFSIIYSLLVPMLEHEQEHFWALGAPLKPYIFFGTEIVFDLLIDGKTGRRKCSIETKKSEQMKSRLMYSLIFEKLYHYPVYHENDWTYSLMNDITGLVNFYKINIDTRFVEVEAKDSLPKLDVHALTSDMDNSDFDWAELRKRIPLSLFRFKGFSIITATDVTSQQALENVKDIVIGRRPEEGLDYYHGIRPSLKTLIGDKDIEFSLLPVFRVNNRLVLTEEHSTFNLMAKSIKARDALEDVESYLENPELVLYNVDDHEVKHHHFRKFLLENGVSSYALLPIYSGNKVAGVLEAYSTNANLLTAAVLSKLDPVKPLLAQLLQHDIDEFNRTIEGTIKEKFTSLQPAVEWKFREEAWRFLNQTETDNKSKSPERIIFKDVFALYGAIDIRNSTVERNHAQLADLVIQFNLLIATLTEIKEKINIAILDELIYKSKNWLRSIENNEINDDNLRIMEFLEEEMKPLLLHFKVTNKALEKVIDHYLHATNEETGKAFHNRRVLEKSMQTVNSAINKFLELFISEAQVSYPCYFEKFRTDGVEYDIYIGQSISPDRAFNKLYLKNIRLWQLSTMASIAQITHAILPQLERKLQTTQLIYIRSASLDIGFRNDERRFDVEGSYNIRYQVIKKRIDKVLVKKTGERLTQPGKIALVFFNKSEAEEYYEYIAYLQSQGTLEKEIEELDLEDLQGVSGLKALRVTVKMNDEIVNEKVETAKDALLAS